MPYINTFGRHDIKKVAVKPTLVLVDKVLSSGSHYIGNAHNGFF